MTEDTGWATERGMRPRNANDPFLSSVRLTEKKRRARGPAQSCRHEADNHLPEGNSWLQTDLPPGRNCISVCLQHKETMRPAVAFDNPGAGMPAMPRPQAYTGFIYGDRRFRR